jgi:hypothetical protein
MVSVTDVASVTDQHRAKMEWKKLNTWRKPFPMPLYPTQIPYGMAYNAGFVVDKVAVGQVFSEYFAFPFSVSFHQCFISIHESTTAIRS